MTDDKRDRHVPVVDDPLWNQDTYWGRVRHFWYITNPLNLFFGDLERARTIVDKYRAGNSPEGYTLEEVYRAKMLLDSAHHPDTGERMFPLGRMSCLGPVNMVIAFGMITWYRTTRGVVFWLWVNQSFNAIINFSNRSGKSQISSQQILASYFLATGGAVATAVTFFRIAQRLPPLAARLVPYTAGATANCINIPIMRSRELMQGVAVHDDEGNHLGDSRVAARRGIAMVILCRNMMGAIVLGMTPLVMRWLERWRRFRETPRIHAPVQLLLCGLLFTFGTPLCCAIFPQKSKIQVAKLEEDIKENAKLLNPPPTEVYYNKGL